MWPDLLKTTVKTYQKNSFVYIQLLYTHNYSVCIQNLFWYVLTAVLSQIRCHKCFDRSGPVCKSDHNLLFNFNVVNKFSYLMMDSYVKQTS